ncbi:MAG TPA: hypothetical protein VG899_02915 [Mycobacteriales bacterium]|nr:hypothetical protein [Mycobacteriales bacterium]
MSGHGELAVIHAHELFLIGGPVSGVHYVGFGNQPSDPQWSADGKLLSVVVTPPPPKHNPYKQEPSFVAVVGQRGKVLREFPRGTKAYDVTTAWSPGADRLAVSYTLQAKNPSNDRDVLSFYDPADGVADGLLAAPDISGFAWSPDGSQLAFASDRLVRSPGNFNSRLVTIDAATDHKRLVTAATEKVIDVAGWWPDGSGILARLDPQGSASLAADGLPLVDVSVADGKQRQLGRIALDYSQWLATSAATNQVAFIAGGDREISMQHKHVVVCSVAACRAIAQGAKQVSFDPAFGASGRLAFVRDRAVAPKHGFGISYVDQVQASGGILTASSGGQVAAVSAGKAASAPTWGTDGSMLVVRRGALWLLGPGLQTAAKVVSGLQLPAGSPYYGFVPWHDSFAWTLAVR